MSDESGFVFSDMEDPDIDGSLSNENDAPSGLTSGFPEVKKLLEDVESRIFTDRDYYKKVFSDGGDSAKRFNAIFQKYVQAKDPSDKTLFRQQMTASFWDYSSNVVKSCGSGLSDPKKFLLRFGMLHPGVLSPESRAFFGKIADKNMFDEPIYYVDEWFSKIGKGEVKASTTDEAGAGKSNESAHFRALLDKAAGKFEGAKGILRTKNAEREAMEKRLVDLVSLAGRHEMSPVFTEIKDVYAENQKVAINEIQELLKALLRLDREISRLLDEYSQGKQDVSAIGDKLQESSSAEAQSFDVASIDTEFGSLRQMAKMTIGRQGNPFPVLNNDYFHSMADNVGFRENIIRKLAWVEEGDCEAFIRIYKNNPSRIVPYVILLPTYGDYGVCWEPFDKHNKATSRGRIAIPMYPKNLIIAVLTAIGDFRWQVAKEIASMYWMDEGLTGNYFQWFQAQKLKGDVKMYFIQDYILWMTKEREGVQKLDKAVRGIFWRYLPFSQPLKDKLKDRNLVYQELYQRDKNRAKSEAY